MSADWCGNGGQMRPPTELEMARAHLRERQTLLAKVRKRVGGGDENWRKTLVFCEATVLAALSWVWDAQERETQRSLEWLRDKFQKALAETLCPPLRNDAPGRQTISDIIHGVTINVLDGRIA